MSTHSSKKGFTIIETLVAVTILVTAIAAVLTVVQRGVLLASSAKTKVVAFYLAQEPIEYIRNVRDSNKLAANAWLYQLDECIAGACTVYPQQGNPIAALDTCPGVCPRLRFDGASGFYGYNPAWTETPYRRTTRIFNPPAGSSNPDEILIEVTVTWETVNVSRSVTVQESLFNW